LRLVWIIPILLLSLNAYAAPFTVTVTATKIDITAGTGTLEQMYQDVEAVDATAMTKTGTDPYTYEVEGNRELEISNNVIVNMYNDSDVLQWDLSANSYPILDISEGGIFNVGDGTVTGDDQQIIGDVNDTYYSYIYVYGSFNLQGTSGHDVVVTQYRSIYFFTADDATDVCDWDYVTLSNPTLSSGYMLAFDGASQQVIPQHTFNNITISDTGGLGYGIYVYNGAWLHDCTFDNITIDNVDRLYIYGASTIKFTNCTFQNIDYYAPLHYVSGGDLSVAHYNTAQTETWGTKYQQSKIVYENCTFDSNYDVSTKYGSYAVARGSLVLFKDCTFQNVAYGVYAYGGGIAIYAGTNTFTNVTTADRRWATNGTHLHVRTLDLTVYKPGGAVALENARVNIRQKDGKEEWSFLTDSNGNIKDVYGDLPVFTEKEETATGVFTQWSDGAGNNVHVMTVSHPDYALSQQEIVFTSDQTISVTMEAEAQAKTKIHSSTIYDSTIY